MAKIYLAIPYSGIEEQSFAIANYVAHKLMQEGHIVYSPISHNHPIAKSHGLPTGWDFWEKFDTEFIKWCDEVYMIKIHVQVYPVKDIRFLDCNADTLIAKSKGVQAEFQIAMKLKKEVSSYHYHGENNSQNGV